MRTNESLVWLYGLFLVSLVLCSDARCQEPESAALAEDQLAEARVRYEGELQEVRELVDAKLRICPNDKALEFSQALKAFQLRGVWPTVIKVARFKAKYEDARRELDAAYVKCFGRLHRGGQDSLKDAVYRERSQWGKVNDLVAWIEVADASGSGKPAASVELPVELPPHYQLEVSGRVEGEGPFRLIVPTKYGECSYVAMNVAGGTFHVMVTYGPDDVLAIDYGARREVEETETGKAHIAAEKGGVELASLRWKGIVQIPAVRLAEGRAADAEIAKDAKVAKAAEAAKPLKDDQLQLWKVGKKLIGTREQHNATVKVVGVVETSTDKTLVLQVTESWTQPSGKYIEVDVRCEYERVAVDPATGRVTLRGTKQTHTRSGDPTIRTNLVSEVVIDGDELTGTYTYSWKLGARGKLNDLGKEYPIELRLSSRKARR